jgi:hypothetical protein
MTARREQPRDARRFPWLVSCFYGDPMAAPRRGGRDVVDLRTRREPGGLAIETQHASRVSADIEVAAGKSRADIGRIVCAGPDGGVVLIRTDGGWVQT